MKVDSHGLAAANGVLGAKINSEIRINCESIVFKAGKVN